MKASRRRSAHIWMNTIEERAEYFPLKLQFLTLVNISCCRINSIYHFILTVEDTRPNIWEENPVLLPPVWLLRSREDSDRKWNNISEHWSNRLVEPLRPLVQQTSTTSLTSCDTHRRIEVCSRKRVDSSLLVHRLFSRSHDRVETLPSCLWSWTHLCYACERRSRTRLQPKKFFLKMKRTFFHFQTITGLLLSALYWSCCDIWVMLCMIKWSYDGRRLSLSQTFVFISGPEEFTRQLFFLKTLTWCIKLIFIMNTILLMFPLHPLVWRSIFINVMLLFWELWWWSSY